MPDLLLTCAHGFAEVLRGDLQSDGHLASLVDDACVRTEAPLDAVRGRLMVDRVAVPLDADLPVGAVEAVLTEVGHDGAVSFRVHHRSPQVRAEWIAAGERAGWRNDVGQWQVNLDVDAGRAEIGPLAWAARFGTMQRLPATTPPAVAAAAVRSAKLRDGDNLLDPCAGVGTIPIVAALHADGQRLAIDLDPDAVDLAQRNVDAFGLGDRVLVESGDATDLDLADGSVDRVVSDVPFGKKVGSTAANDRLYPGVVAELGRVLAPDGRAVIITDDKRRFTDAVARERSLKVVKEHRMAYNGVTPTAFVLARVRRRR